MSKLSTAVMVLALLSTPACVQEKGRQAGAEQQASAELPVDEQPTGPVNATEGPIEGSGAVRGYTTDTAGHHSVNNYWLVGDAGLVVIDAHWRLSDARRALEHLRRTSRKPIEAILLTHPHSDHYGGLPVFLKAARDDGGRAEYFASEWSARSIRNDEQGFRANREQQFGRDFPSELPAPTGTVIDRQPLNVAGFRIVPILLRQNEAIETVLFHVPEQSALFTGDIVNQGTLPILLQGGLDSWISQLESLLREIPNGTIIYPGHGRPGPAQELIRAQIDVLAAHRDSVAAALRNDGAVDAAERNRIVAAIEQRFPSYRTTAGVPARRQLISQNIDSVLKSWQIKSSSTSGIEGQ